jgi:hypothetical protein
MKFLRAKKLSRKESVTEDKSAVMDTQKSACLFRDYLRKNNPPQFCGAGPRNAAG